MKKIKLIFCTLYLFCSIIVYSQESNFQIVNSINVNIEDVKDFTFTGTNFYLLTNNMLYTLNIEGAIIDTIHHNNITGIFWGNDTLLYIDSLGFIINKNTNNILTNLHFDENHQNTAVFLTNNQDNYFTCLVIGDLSERRMSWSSRIISLDNNWEQSFFARLTGLPAGLYADDDFLWYLSRKLKINEFGRLYKFDVYTQKTISRKILPIKDPVGFVIVNDFIYTYSTNTNEIYKLLKTQ